MDAKIHIIPDSDNKKKRLLPVFYPSIMNVHPDLETMSADSPYRQSIIF